MIEFIIDIIWTWNFSVENVWTMFLILYIHKIVQISISIKVSCVTLYVLMNFSILSKLLHLWAFWGLVYPFSYSFNICRIYRDVPFFLLLVICIFSLFLLRSVWLMYQLSLYEEPDFYFIDFCLFSFFLILFICHFIFILSFFVLIWVQFVLRVAGNSNYWIGTLLVSHVSI